MKKGWTHANPVAAVDRPRDAEPDPDIRFLEHEEIEALLRAIPDDELGRIERPLYLVAATCGLRQGELVALRWRDVDWLAGLVRVRRNYTRKNWGTPKSRRSSRAVPMIARVAGELDRLNKSSRFTADDDLVFAHRERGSVYDPSKMRKRFIGAATEQASAQSGFTTCATPSEPRPPPRECHYERCRNGWVTATTRPR
jgi:integrase